MLARPRPLRGRGGTLAAAAAALLGLFGTSAIVVGLQSRGGPPQPVAVAAPAVSALPASTTITAPAVGAASMAHSRPVTLSVPSIGMSSDRLVDLHKNADGSLQVPAEFDQPGWYADGPSPGQFGPAVLAGHVDSKSGPGIFYRLGAVRPGDRVQVTRADASVATFRVDEVERYAKDAFPTHRVYGDTTHRSELRLITCGGNFDRRTGHYVDNVVAYAHLV